MAAAIIEEASSRNLSTQCGASKAAIYHLAESVPYNEAAKRHYQAIEIGARNRFYCFAECGWYRPDMPGNEK